MKSGRQWMTFACKVDGCTSVHRAKGFCARHYASWYKGWTIPTANLDHVTFGSYGEQCFYNDCLRRGRAAEKTPYQSPFDLLVDGWRVDVKAARPVNHFDGLKWQFRLHVHGRKSDQIDLYVLRLEDVPQAKPVCLLLRAPVKAWAYQVTFASLLKKRELRKAMDDYDLFLSGAFGQRLEVVA